MPSSKKSQSRSSNAKPGNGKFWLAVLGAIASILILTALTYTVIHGLGFTANNDNPELNSLYIQISIALSAITIVLLVYLLTKYFEVWFITHSSFSLGLIVLVWCLMTLTILANPLFVSNAGYQNTNGAFIFLPDVLRLLTALVLIYLVHK